MNENRLLEFLEFFENQPTNKEFSITEKERKSFPNLIVSCFLFDMVCEYYDKIENYKNNFKLIKKPNGKNIEKKLLLISLEHLLDNVQYKEKYVNKKTEVLDIIEELTRWTVLEGLLS